MRKLLLCGALAAATAMPALAQAQPRCVNPRTNATAGALVGAAGGALIGSQLASRGSRDKGAVLGALGGALLGGAVGNSQTRCPEGYYREEGGRYYDNSGAEYNPSGYAPPPQQGYAPPPPAYGPPQGAYNNDQYAYDREHYTNVRPGYYAPGATSGFWRGAPERLADRISFTEQQVRTAADRRWIDRREARRAFDDINNVRAYMDRARAQNGGHMRQEDRRYVEDQLNYISQRVKWQSRN